MTAPVKSLRYAWLVVALLWFVAMLNYLDRLMITSMREWIVADIPMSDARFGLLTSVFLWVYGVMSPVGGFLADRYSRKWVIMASLAIWSLMTWLTAHMHGFGTLLAARAVMGLSEACYISAALALIADYHVGRTRSLATGLHQSGLYAGAALGGAGGWIAADHGWRLAFTLFGAVGVVYSFVLLFALRDKPAEDAPHAGAGGAGKDVLECAPEKLSLRSLVSALGRSRAFWLLLLYTGLAGMAFWLIYGWLPTFLQERFVGWKPQGWLATVLPAAASGWEITRGSAGLWATVPVQISSFVGILLGGALADRWSVRDTRARTFLPAIGFCCAGPCLFLLVATDSFLFAFFAMVVFGVGRGFADANLMPIVCDALDRRYSATVYGMLNFVGVSVGGGMIYVGGWLRDCQVGLSLPFALAGAGLLAAGVIMLFVIPRRGR